MADIYQIIQEVMKIFKLLHHRHADAYMSSCHNWDCDDFKLSKKKVYLFDFHFLVDVKSDIFQHDCNDYILRIYVIIGVSECWCTRTILLCYYQILINFRTLPYTHCNFRY